MAYEICKECGCFFDKNGKTLCNTCYEKDIEIKKKVKDYVYTHKNVSVLEVVNATGVPLKTLFRYLDEGSLSYAREERHNTYEKKLTIKNDEM